MKNIILLLLVFALPIAAAFTSKDTTGTKLRVFLLDKKVLEKNKKEIQSNENSVPKQYKQLIKTADELLKEKPHSVTEKEQTPPSGDKHDYMSMGKYWWPNPDSTSGAAYIRKDGVKNPEVGDITDHTYFKETTEKIFQLGLAYYFSENERYAEKAVEFLRVWFLHPDTKMNPNLNFSQAVKGHNTGRGSGVLDGHTLEYVVEGIGLLEKSPSLTKDDREGITRWFTEYRSWLLESKNGKDEAKAKNNHGSWYDIQVMTISLFIGQNDFAKQYAERLKNLRIDNYIEPDGRLPEELARTRAHHYSYFNLEALCQFAVIARNLGSDYVNYISKDGRSIKKAFEFLYPFTSGEKNWTYQQIDKLDHDTSVSALLYAYKLFGDKKYLDLASKIDGDKLKSHFEILYLY